MSISINGTTINSIKFNNTDINTLICNGEEVYSGVPAIYNTVKNATTAITEAQWLEFIDNDCIALAISRGETANFLRKVVIINNSNSSYNEWSIADFNHDGNQNTCDLIHNKNYVGYQKFSSTGNSKKYYNSVARTWLRNTFVTGFSEEILSKLVTVYSDTIGDDKAKLLSFVELNGYNYGDKTEPSLTDGTTYPIYNHYHSINADDTRIVGNSSYWTRSGTGDYQDQKKAWYVSSTGSMALTSTSSSLGIVPCIRFKYKKTPPAIYNIVKNKAEDITESEWLEFINTGCVELVIDLDDKSSFIGKNVIISNSVVPDYTSWKIADFGHDRTSYGWHTNSVDLVQNNIINTSSTNVDYVRSAVRTWLIDTYLLGFNANIQNKLQTTAIKSKDGTTTVYDKIRLLSTYELNIETASTTYPIFTDNASRIRDNTDYWTFTNYIYNNVTYVYFVNSTGAYSGRGIVSSIKGIVPMIRMG